MSKEKDEKKFRKALFNQDTAYCQVYEDGKGGTIHFYYKDIASAQEDIDVSTSIGYTPVGKPYLCKISKILAIYLSSKNSIQGLDGKPPPPLPE